MGYNPPAMGRGEAGELSASVAILGLLVEQPDCTAGVSRRLAERYPRARFARNAAHSIIPSLERQGLVQVVDGSEGRSRREYEITRQGVEDFQAWKRTSPTQPPPLRDALRAKLEQADGEEELAALIEVVASEEELCAAECDAAHARLAASRRRRRARASEGDDWLSRLDLVLLADETVIWAARAERLQRLRASLERMVHGIREGEDCEDR